MSQPKVRDVLASATARLRAAGVPDPARDARRLLAAAAENVAPGPDDPITGAIAARFDGMIARRQARQPVSHIVGHREFYGRKFIVGQDVLDPRPETETLIEIALSEPFSRVLDLGTGSGAILLTLLAERPEATGIGTDLSQDALDTAADNPLDADVDDRRVLIVSDWFEGVTGPFDLIVSNPPYIASAECEGLQPEVRDHEPRLALDGGADGLDAYRAIAAGCMDHLAPGGRLIVEIGPTQAAAVSGLFQAAGLSAIEVFADLDGRDRVVLGRRSGN